MPNCAVSFMHPNPKLAASAEREFYKSYSARHRPKEYKSLLRREEENMASLRFERNTKGFSEGFPTRRLFPVLHIEPEPEMEYTDDEAGGAPSSSTPATPATPATSSPGLRRGGGGVSMSIEEQMAASPNLGYRSPRMQRRG